MVGDATDGPLVFPAAHLVGDTDEADFFINQHQWTGGDGTMMDVNLMKQKRPRSNDDIMYATGGPDIIDQRGVSSHPLFPYYSDEAVAQRAKITPGFLSSSLSSSGGIISARAYAQPGSAAATTGQSLPRINLLEEQFKVAYAAAVSATDPDPYTTARRSVDHLLPEYAKFANVGHAPLGGWTANTSRRHYAEILTGSFAGPDLDLIVNSNGGAVIKPDGTGFHISEAQLAQMNKAQNLLKAQSQVVAKKPVRAVKPAAGRLLTTTSSRSKPVVAAAVATAAIGLSTAADISSSL